MVSKEQIAHDLTIIYLSNRYGMDVRGSFDISDGSGCGKIETEHFPGTNELKYKKVGSGEKKLFGIEKKVKVEDGYKIDELFVDILNNYRKAYRRFMELLENEE